MPVGASGLPPPSAACIAAQACPLCAVTPGAAVARRSLSSAARAAARPDRGFRGWRRGPVADDALFGYRRLAHEQPRRAEHADEFVGLRGPDHLVGAGYLRVQDVLCAAHNGDDTAKGRSRSGCFVSREQAICMLPLGRVYHRRVPWDIDGDFRRASQPFGPAQPTCRCRRRQAGVHSGRLPAASRTASTCQAKPSTTRRPDRLSLTPS